MQSNEITRTSAVDPTRAVRPKLDADQPAVIVDDVSLTGTPPETPPVRLLPAASKPDEVPLILQDSGANRGGTISQTDVDNEVVWAQFEANKPSLFTFTEPDAARVPASIPRVAPRQAVLFARPNASGPSLNTNSTYFMEVDGLGVGVAKRETNNERSNTQCEAITADIDALLPAVAPGLEENIVPPTRLIYIEKPFAATLRDGSAAKHEGAAGLYSFQQKLPNVAEYIDVAAPDKAQGFHPNYIRLAYLDAETDNWDRNRGNWMVQLPKCGIPADVDGRTLPLKAHDNGTCLSRAYSFLDDEGFGWQLRDLGVIAPEHMRTFLEQSLDYSLRAKEAQPDAKLDAIFNRYRGVPHYESFAFNRTLERVKFNRERIPDMIRQQLKKLDEAPPQKPVQNELSL